LTVDGNYNRKGASPNSGDGLRTALLPTLSAASYGSNKGGAAAREGQLERPSLETLAKRGMLPTLTASAAERALSGRGSNAQGGKNLAETLLPTLTTRDEKGPGPANKSKGGRDLPHTLGGHLNPQFCGSPVALLDNP